MEDYILKQLKNKVDDVVVASDIDNSTQIKFVNNEIVTTKSWATKDISIFAVKDKRVVATPLRLIDMEGQMSGIPSTKNKTQVDKTIKQILKFLSIIPPKKDYFGIAKGPFKYNQIPETFDKRIAELGDKGVDIVEDAISLALKNGAKRATGVLDFGSGETVSLTSSNVSVKEKGTSISLSLRAFRDKNASGHKVVCSRTLNNFNLSNVAEAGMFAKQAVKPKTCKVGKYDILFEPLPFAVLLGNVMSSASIDSVEAGFSFLGNKLNKKTASSSVNLFDDATLANGLSSSISDAEGVPSQRNSVIKDGVLKTYLHNTSTAKKYKTKTTANAGLISPEPTNIILQPGKLSKDEILSKIKNGLWITNIWYTRFQNYSTGDFSTIPRDAIFLIKNGKISHPVSDIRITDNMLNILKSVSAIAKTPEQILGWEADTPTLTPHVLVKGLKITKSTN